MIAMTGSSPGLKIDTVSASEVGGNPPDHHAEVSAQRGRWSRLRGEWDKRLDPAQQAVVLSWASFTTTFVGVRALTHWIKGGHGPSGGGMSVGGQHFHHYNIGIALLSVVGGVGLRGAEKHRRHPATAIAYGSATALIVDELALLLDLKDVYWANDGRKSVDVAVTLIAAGGLTVAGLPLWPHARRALKSQ
jgi:hypothetical protein